MITLDISVEATWIYIFGVIVISAGLAYYYGRYSNGFGVFRGPNKFLNRVSDIDDSPLPILVTILWPIIIPVVLTVWIISKAIDIPKRIGRRHKELAEKKASRPGHHDTKLGIQLYK